MITIRLRLTYTHMRSVSGSYRDLHYVRSAGWRRPPTYAHPRARGGGGGDGDDNAVLVPLLSVVVAPPAEHRAHSPLTAQAAQVGWRAGWLADEAGACLLIRGPRPINTTCLRACGGVPQLELAARLHESAERAEAELRKV
eukprot:COSAG01_NODE_18495_length_1072_cov_1.066804_2_plen_141_part_00